MAMSQRLDGLEKVVVGIGSLLEKLDARLAPVAVATTETTEVTEEAPVEKLEKIEEPKEDGNGLAKFMEGQAEGLRKVTEVITQLEARLAKIENEPVPGGPFLTGEAMEKAAKAGLLSVADKSLATNVSGGEQFDPANKAQAAAVLRKYIEEVQDPYEKERLGKLAFELDFRAGLDD